MQPIFAMQQKFMRIAVIATGAQKQEWLQKPVPANAEIIFIDAIVDIGNIQADIFFHLSFDETNTEFIDTDKPVFASAVITVLDSLPANYIRINAWNGFFKRDLMEVVAAEKNKQTVKTVMQAFNWKYIFAPDVPGMIAAKTISMIINEAYFAFGDEVSTKEEIDTAMKLGTNYPYGPFEWGEKIGLQKIYMLLNRLFTNETRYAAAPLLLQEATEKLRIQNDK